MSVLKAFAGAMAACLLLAPCASAQGPFGPYPTNPTPAPSTQPPPATAPQLWGAIAFTADGSYATGWKHASKPEAEADVAKRCAKFGRGACEVVAFRGELCVALSTYIGSHSGRRWKLSFTGGGTTSPQAQKTAMDQCNADRRTRNRCQLRTVVCGDGR